MDINTRTLMMGSAGTGGETYWYTGLSTSNIDRPGRMDIDTAGNVYVSGSFLYTTFNKVAGVVIKLSPSGEVQWQTFFYLSSEDVLINDVAVDNAGNVYAVGTASNFHFVSKIDAATGSALVTTRPNECRLGDTSIRRLYGSHIEFKNSSIYIMGQLEGKGIGIQKYDTALNSVWIKAIEGAFTDYYGGGLAIDSSENIYVSGNYNSGGNWYYLAKLSSAGSISWQVTNRNSASNTYQIANGIAIDSSGNICVAARRASASIGNNPTTDAAFYKVDPSSGSFLLGRVLERDVTGQYQHGRGIAVDSSSNIYLVGGADNRGLIAKYNSSGTLQWQRTISKLYLQPSFVDYTPPLVGDIKVTDKDVYILGGNDGSFSGQLEIFVMKVPADGSKTGTYSPQNITYAASSLNPISESLSATGQSLTFSTPTTSFRSSAPSRGSNPLTQTLVTI